MAIIKNIRLETTNSAAQTTSSNFNAPGQYIPPYGRANFSVTARMAPGNNTQPGNTGQNPPNFVPGFTFTVPGNEEYFSNDPTFIPGNPGYEQPGNPSGTGWKVLFRDNCAGNPSEISDCMYGPRPGNNPSVPCPGGVQFTVYFADPECQSFNPPTFVPGNPGAFIPGNAGNFFNPPFTVFVPPSGAPGNFFSNPPVPGNPGPYYAVLGVGIPGAPGDTSGNFVTASVPFYSVPPAGQYLTIPTGASVNISTNPL